MTLIVNLDVFDETPLEQVSHLMEPEYGVEPPHDGNAYSPADYVARIHDANSMIGLAAPQSDSLVTFSVSDS